MSEFIFKPDVCSHDYFPGNETRNVNRFCMKTLDNTTVGWIDYFIENGWSKFLVISVDPNYRNEEVVSEFIRQVYVFVSEPKKTFWWSATPEMKKYFDIISTERPDITFAASGAINRIVYATA